MQSMSGSVGMRGFEPPTSRTLSECANRTALHPERSDLRGLQIKYLIAS